jgi:hypothetical protein
MIHHIPTKTKLYTNTRSLFLMLVNLINNKRLMKNVHIYVYVIEIVARNFNPRHAN